MRLATKTIDLRMADGIRNQLVADSVWLVGTKSNTGTRRFMGKLELKSSAVDVGRLDKPR